MATSRYDSYSSTLSDNTAWAPPMAVTRSSRLTSDDWSDVISVNKLLHGFVLDHDQQSLCRAREAAFKLENSDGFLQDPLPRWEVYDDSCIDIETISTKLQHLSVQHGFSADAAQSAFVGTAMFLSAAENSNVRPPDSKEILMHATYRFPRVRIVFDDTNISLSEDCIDAIRHIEQSKSLEDVQQFYNTYGHLFVTQATLGGRLRATRHLPGDQPPSTIPSTQSAWKAALAASLSPKTTLVNAKGTDEGICWEAHGGNTSLVNNHNAWSTTVDNHWYWRVVQQEKVVPLEDIISQIEGFEHVRGLFVDIILDNIGLAGSADILWNGAGKAVLGSGIAADSMSTLIRQQILKPNGIRNFEEKSTCKWSVINDNASLKRYLKEKFKETINPYVGTRLFPKLVWRLGLSDRAFSVVTTLRSGLETSTATFTTDKFLAVPDTNAQVWREMFGDLFVHSVTQGHAVHVCWVFSRPTYSADLPRAKDAVLSFFSGSQASFEVGCAYLSRIATETPCEAYIYDAYYNEVKAPSVLRVAPTVLRRIRDDAKQVISVGLTPYQDVDVLKPMASATVVDPVSPAGLDVVRRDHAEFAFQRIKRQSAVAMFDPTMGPTYPQIVSSFASPFSPATYAGSWKRLEGDHQGATGLAKDYSDLYERADRSFDQRSLGWLELFGDANMLSNNLTWIRKSQQAETDTLFNKARSPGSTVFGLRCKPTPDASLCDTETANDEGGRLRTIASSLRHTAITRIEPSKVNITSNGNESLDVLWKYTKKGGSDSAGMTISKNTKVVAYELTCTEWDGTGTPPEITRTGQIKFSVGQDIETFAQGRLDTMNDAWAVTNVWLINAPFRWTDITRRD